MSKIVIATGFAALAAFAPASSGTAQETQWVDAFTTAVQRCWTPPANASGIAVVLDVELETDGSVRRVDGDPELFEQIKEGEIAFDAALRAVLRCAPYAMLPAENYEDWQHMRITFDAAF